MLDARAIAALLIEVFNFYEAFGQGRNLELPPPRAYRDYIQWLQKRDWSAAETFWREQLKGFATPTPLVISRSAGQAPDRHRGHSVEQVILPATEAAKLRLVAKENGLTVNTLLQGAWAVLLSRYSGEEDVLFGVVRACRRSSVEGASSTIGLFINTLPLRVRVAAETRVLDWLKELRAQNLAMRDHEHTPLVEVRRHPGQPGPGREGAGRRLRHRSGGPADRSGWRPAPHPARCGRRF